MASAVSRPAACCAAGRDAIIGLPTIRGDDDEQACRERQAESDEPRGALSVRITAMPGDINANGDIFGGWVMSRMDQAGGIAGVDRAQGRVVTVAVDAMTFIHPVKVGDVLSVYTEIESGRPDLDAHPCRGLGQAPTARRLHEKVDATFTLVVIDEEATARAEAGRGLRAAPIATRS